MRFLTNSMLAVLVAVAIVGCSGASNSSDNSSNSSAMSSDNSSNSAMSSDNSSSSSDNSSAMSDNSAASPAAAGSIPSYPGAATAASGSSNTGSMGAASGTVLTTSDSFDKVYAWYHKTLPAGTEKAHTAKSAVFTEGDPSNMQTVTISTQGGKTMITIASVKK